MDIGAIALGFTMLCQLAGVIWFAAKFDSAVGELRSVTAELKESKATSDGILTNHGERIRVLEIQRAADDRRTDEMERTLRAKGAL